MQFLLSPIMQMHYMILSKNSEGSLLKFISKVICFTKNIRGKRDFREVKASNVSIP